MEKNTLAIIAVVAVVLLIAISVIYVSSKSNDMDSGYGLFTKKPGAGKPKPTYQCNDHIDNDGDGYCDFGWRKASCNDGSIPGDSDCVSKDDNNEMGDCVPACNSNSDCGTNGYIGNLYCLGDGNVYKDYVSYVCENAGKCNAVCNSQTSSYLWQNCLGYGCANGVCLSGNQTGNQTG